MPFAQSDVAVARCAGEGWQRIPSPADIRMGSELSVTSLAVDITQNDRLYLTSTPEGGQYTDDCGRTWGESGFFWGHQLVIDQQGTFYLSRYYATYLVSRDHGATWDVGRIQDGSNRLIGLYSATVSPVAPGTVIGVFYRFNTRSPYGWGRSDDYGLTWTGYRRGGGSTHMAAGLTVDTVYLAGHTPPRLLVTDTTQNGFHTLATFDAEISGLAMASDGSRLWVSTETGGLHVSRDLGEHWSDVSLPDGARPLQYLLTHHADPSVLYVVDTGGGIWVYRDVEPAKQT